MILIDTDICIELLKGNKKILQRRGEYEGPIGICFMTIAELYYGAEKSRESAKNIDTIDKLLLTLEIVQSDLTILRRFGSLKAQLRKEGIPLADADILIASATLERAEKLVTGNKKHYERIPGLVLEDWR
jgi:tRNA(fMet)-specific endonuclease VapC